jgi:hypothetical protein
MILQAGVIFFRGEATENAPSIRSRDVAGRTAGFDRSGRERGFGRYRRLAAFAEKTTRRSGDGAGTAGRAYIDVSLRERSEKGRPLFAELAGQSGWSPHEGPESGKRAKKKKALFPEPFNPRECG